MAAARLGDIIDDYCSRCRMLTNHSVMALVGEEVRKVICRTCQYTHDYKQGKGAEKKKAKPSAKQSAFDQVLASVLSSRTMEEAPKVAVPKRPSRSLGQSRQRSGTAAAPRHPLR